MEFVEHTVTGALADIVGSLFHLRGYSPDDPVERIVPDGATTLVIELDGQKRSVLDCETRLPSVSCVGSWFSGIHRNHMLISVPSDTELIAIRFRPGLAFAVVGTPMHELCDRVVAATSLFGEPISMLRARLLAEESVATRLLMVESFLGDSFRRDTGPPAFLLEAVKTITAEPTVSTIKELCRSLGVSDTHLVTLFRKHVGVSPKTLQQIMRFSSALSAIQRSESVNWVEVSLECGYYDQSHFIRDFSRFSGFQPAEFLGRGDDRANFFPESTESDK